MLSNLRNTFSRPNKVEENFNKKDIELLQENQKCLLGPQININLIEKSNESLNLLTLNDWCTTAKGNDDCLNTNLKLFCNLKRNSLKIILKDENDNEQINQTDHQPLESELELTRITTTNTNQSNSNNDTDDNDNDNDDNVSNVNNNLSLKFKFDCQSPKCKIIITNQIDQHQLYNDVLNGGYNLDFTLNNFSNQVHYHQLNLIIDLICCDENSNPISPLNIQSTHLSIQNLYSNSNNPVWVLKLVKRLGIIGKLFFTLHDIFGLSSHTKQSLNTYPPSNQSFIDDHTGGDCIICLASPRDTLLLPCRHLVACKDCALRMTDFGGGNHHNRSGGIWGENNDNVNESNDRVIAAEAGNANSLPDDNHNNDINNHNNNNNRHQRRRKRKAKGWFCPICRQRKFQNLKFIIKSINLYLIAYTAMLRINLKDGNSNKLSNDDDDDIESNKKDDVSSNSY